MPGITTLISITHKEGVIVRIVKHCDTPWKVAIEEFPDHKPMFDSRKVACDLKEAYLVEVLALQNAKPRLYLPLPKRLIKIEE